MDFKKDLNEKQYEAATTDYIHVRIVAGAGSGKTRVLTYRIAFLISEMDVYPSHILAITFTNKVANEMKERVARLVPGSASKLQIRTFHSFASYFLRQEIDAINYPKSFTILDEEDQTKIVKDIAASMNFKRSDPIVKLALGYIASSKLKEKYPEDISIEWERFKGEKDCLEIYKRYEGAKENMLALDFDDLLLKTNFILEKFPAIRAKWQDKYSNILIDEFQDTNDTEYKMISLLMKPSTSLYVVGDPDQTIYTWRGANQKIIINLNYTFPDMETIILNENYRSTQNILDSANKVIAKNKMRIHKDLFTHNGKGDPITTKVCMTTRSEADYVSKEIKNLLVKGYRYSDIAILYRSNYVTQEFEQSFVLNRIPYKIFGGLKFYQRKEIKDVLAYFNLIINTRDDLAFERIINVPRRGIGETSIEVMKEEARDNSMSMYDYMRQADPANTRLSKKVVKETQNFISRIDEAREDINKNEEVYSKILEDLIIDINYYNYLKEDEDDGDDRVENVKSLFGDIRHFLETNPESTFDEYLQNVALLSAQDELVEGDFVNLMTVHTAKGLEFPVVFVVRVNDGVFPSGRSQIESGYEGLEEERRLFYVAMTRAMDKLYLTLSSDFSYVTNGKLTPSQFLAESGNGVKTDTYNPYGGGQTYIKKSFFDDGPHGYISQEKKEPFKQEYAPKTNGITSWAVGDICIHAKLGRGVVVAVEEDMVIKVNFDEHGLKTIMGNHPMVSKGEK